MKRRNAYAWTALGTTLLLLTLLFGFLGVWVLYGSAANVMSQIGIQRAREQHMLKDVLVLSYRSSTTERTQAISELQDSLPVWEKTQAGLQSGDSTLGLPKHPPSDIVLLLIQTQSDYTPMDVAFKKINAAASRPDPAQMQILLDHERGYFLAMSQVNTLWQQHIDDVFLQLFWIETGLVAVITVLVIVNFVFMCRALRSVP